MIEHQRNFPGNRLRLDERRILKRQIAIEQSKQDNLSRLIKLKKFFKENERSLAAASKCYHMLPGQLISGYYHIVFRDQNQRIFADAAHCFAFTFDNRANGRCVINISGGGVHLQGIYKYPVTILDYPIYKPFHEDPGTGNINLSLKRFYGFLDNFLGGHLEKDFPGELEKFNYIGWSPLEYNTFAGTKDYFDKKKNVFYGYVAELDLRYESETYEGLEESFKRAIDHAIKRRFDLPVGEMTPWESFVTAGNVEVAE